MKVQTTTKLYDDNNKLLHVGDKVNIITKNTTKVYWKEVEIKRISPESIGIYDFDKTAYNINYKNIIDIIKIKNVK